eukprot:TRINITY_DN4335_c0_g2_i3.p1 TRINITY_DN4335_c0_g2~~TRINITY_DN4335_c0_g2_i3.p1  ORF type:complete len:394 (+),score=130.94 TRINITY_DN4335_c0_g2_i3:90-1184(+)
MSTVIIFSGVTQAGKSSTVRTLMPPGAQNEPAVGDGSGQSVTGEWRIFDTVVGKVADGPGTHDTGLRFSKQDYGMLAAACVIEATKAGCTQLKHVAVCSLAEGCLTVRPTLADLAETFGPEALKSTVVLLNKADSRSGDDLDRRVEKARLAAAEKGVSAVVVWQNVGLSAGKLREQRLQLSKALQGTPGTPCAQLRSLQDRIALKAKSLCDAQPVRTRTEMVTEQGTEKKGKWENTWECVGTQDVQETVQEEYPHIEMVTEMIPEQRSRKVRRGLGGLFCKNATKIYTEYVPTQVQKVETRTRKVARTVKKPKYQWVKRWREESVPYSRQVPRKVTEPRLPVKDFMHRAAQEVCEEARRAICTH